MRRLRNRISRAKGWGGCYRCGDSWSYKPPHSTPYDDGRRACFPLCEECWQKLTPVEREPYYEALWNEWQRQAAMLPESLHATWERDYGPDTHAQIINAVRKGL